ncbi:hypothetical protein K8T06_06125 [bacterium]|nr:hypothetical protein [bacterium]
MSATSKSIKYRPLMLTNYLCLLTMNICFYFVTGNVTRHHIFDIVGIIAFAGVVITFQYLYIRSGLWKLIHSKAIDLDERELQITHQALAKSYAWFTVICLAIMLIHAVLFRFLPDINLVITVPLVVSLIYLAHTLPAAVLAWTEPEKLHAD